MYGEQSAAVRSWKTRKQSDRTPHKEMHEVQPSRLLPFQISTFDCQEQAMNIAGRSPFIFVTKVLIFSDLSPIPGPITTVHNRLLPHVSGFAPRALFSCSNPKRQFMQQEDDLRALAKIVAFIQAVGIICNASNIYWFCYE